MNKLKTASAIALAVGVFGGASLFGTAFAADTLNPEQERTASQERETGGGQAAPGQYTGSGEDGSMHSDSSKGSSGSTMSEDSAGSGHAGAMEAETLNPEQERTAAQDRQTEGGQAAPGQNDPAMGKTAAEEGSGGSMAGETDALRAQADELIGKDVVNNQGEGIGEIEDLVRDPQNGNILAIISVGGFLGLGEKNVAIPFEELQASGDGEDLTLMSQSSADELKQMPEYDEDQYQSLQDTESTDQQSQ